MTYHPEEIIIHLSINPFKKKDDKPEEGFFKEPMPKVTWYKNNYHTSIITPIKQSRSVITFKLPKQLFQGAIVISEFDCTKNTQVRCQIWNETEYDTPCVGILPSVLNLCPGHRNTLSITGAEIRKKGTIEHVHYEADLTCGEVLLRSTILQIFGLSLFRVKEYEIK